MEQEIIQDDGKEPQRHLRLGFVVLRYMNKFDLIWFG